ncbi:MFS transporter [Tsuneonella sp. HG222]
MTATSTTFSEALSRQPIRAFSIATFAVCMLVLVADGMDAQLLGLVAPRVIEEFGTDRGSFGWAMSAALVGFGIGSWGGGWLGDTIGRRWSLALATVVFSLATIGASTAADVWHMAMWRLVSGLGFGSAYANAIALAGEWLPDRWRSIGVTTLSVGTPAGGFVIAGLLPTLNDIYTWRGIFVLTGAFTLAIVVLIVAVLRDSPSFLLARGQRDKAHTTAARVLDGPQDLVEEGSASGTASSGGVFAPGNARLNLGVGLSFVAAALVAYGMLNWATSFLEAKGFSPDDAAYAVFVGGITSVGGSMAVGLLVQWLGSRAVMLGLAGALAVTLVAFGAMLEGLPAAPGPDDVFQVTAVYGIAGMIFSGAIASLYALMTHAYPPSCRSAGIGFGIFIGRIGAVAASGLGGWLIDMGDGSLVPFFAVLTVAAVLFTAAPLLIERSRHVPPASRTH